MKKNKMLLEEAEDEVKFVDDDVFYSDEPVPVDLPPVETPVEPVVEPEVVHNAYTDIMQDLLRKQWDVINACDGIIATLATEENANFDKEAVTSVLRSLADDITASVGMTTKAMSVVDPTQDELMKEGERKAEDAIDASEKEVTDNLEEAKKEYYYQYDIYCWDEGYEVLVDSEMEEYFPNASALQKAIRSEYGKNHYAKILWTNDPAFKDSKTVTYSPDEKEDESLKEANDIYGLFAIEIDPQTGKKIADWEGGKAVETGSKEELQPKIREYESSWNVNPQGKTYRFSIRRITSESVNEDVQEIEVDDLANEIETDAVVVSDTIPETFEEQMDFLAADEQEAIDGYDKVIAVIEDEHVKEQLEKIKTEEIAHKEFLEKVKSDRGLEYTEPLEPEEEKVDEDVETAYQLSRNKNAFSDLDWWQEYWAWEALSHIENKLESTDEEDLIDGESDEFILNNLDEDALKDLCSEVAEHVGNYDYLWETIDEYIGYALDDIIKKHNYLERVTNYSSIRVGNNPEGENE